MSDTENKKGLIEVIEDLMDKNLQEKAAKAAEADMTKKDEIENPQDDSAKEEVKEEGQDTSVEKNVNDKELPDAEKETIANKQAAAPTAEVLPIAIEPPDPRFSAKFPIDILPAPALTMPFPMEILP